MLESMVEKSSGAVLLLGYVVKVRCPTDFGRDGLPGLWWCHGGRHTVSKNRGALITLAIGLERFWNVRPMPPMLVISPLMRLK